MRYLLLVITRKLVALKPELGYSRFREEPIQVVSVRITQRFAGHGGVAADLGRVLRDRQAPREIEGLLFYGLLAESADAAASRAVTSSGFESLEAHQFVDRFVLRNLIARRVSRLQGVSKSR